MTQFMDLPAEIREQIYRFPMMPSDPYCQAMLRECVYQSAGNRPELRMLDLPYEWVGDTIVYGNQEVPVYGDSEETCWFYVGGVWKFPTKDRRMISRTMLDINLLLTCKQIHEEASDLLLREARIELLLHTLPDGSDRHYASPGFRPTSSMVPQARIARVLQRCRNLDLDVRILDQHLINTPYFSLLTNRDNLRTLTVRWDLSYNKRPGVFSSDTWAGKSMPTALEVSQLVIPTHGQLASIKVSQKASIIWRIAIAHEICDWGFHWGDPMTITFETQKRLFKEVKKLFEPYVAELEKAMVHGDNRCVWPLWTVPSPQHVIKTRIVEMEDAEDQEDEDVGMSIFG
ncbi:hypothetical protein EJ08DRAFT_734695 [Tothia fuscella]|uniref:Uncharacterized protein n=1 Tax=Tothia fuscella TaxID=1048955 RepID=A0A9P4NQD7_9PEZI|nr:hypothetical protein EJ08DRAFT_734695 [Tothia fuscella]